MGVSSAAVSPCSSVSFSPSTRSPVSAAPNGTAPGYHFGQSQSSYAIRSPRDRVDTHSSERSTAYAHTAASGERMSAQSRESLQSAPKFAQITPSHLDEDENENEAQEIVSDTYFMFEPLAVAAQRTKQSPSPSPSPSSANTYAAPSAPLAVARSSPPSQPVASMAAMPSPLTPHAEMDTYCDFSPADLRDLLASPASQPSTCATSPQPQPNHAVASR